MTLRELAGWEFGIGVVGVAIGIVAGFSDLLTALGIGLVGVAFVSMGVVMWLVDRELRDLQSECTHRTGERKEQP